MKIRNRRRFGLSLGLRRLSLAACAMLAVAAFADGAIFDTQHADVAKIKASVKSTDLVSLKASTSPNLYKLRGMAAYLDKAGMESILNPKYTFDVKSSGEYSIFLRYLQASNSYDNIQLRVARADTGETIRFQFIEYDSAFPAKPAKPVNRKQAFVWAKIDVAFEFPQKYFVEILQAYGVATGRPGDWGTRALPRPVTDIWLSNDPSFDPSRNPAESAAPLCHPVAAPGFKLARSIPLSTKLNTIMPQRERLQLGFHECYPFYMDTASTLNLGISINYQGTDKLYYGEHYDAFITGQPDFSARELERIYPMPKRDENGKYVSTPVGRMANSRGEYSKNFSYSFKPFRDMCYSNAVASMKSLVAGPLNKYILNWYSAWEQCGDYDYGETSVAAFREYLKERYGGVAGVNKAWRTTYGSLEDVQPVRWADCVGKDKLTNSLALARAKANFIDFRDFNSKAYATWLGLKTKAIQENDPEKRGMSSQYSNNNIGSIMWLRWRPVSFEDSMQYTMKGSPTMGWDIYGSDDLVGASFEHWVSFSDDKSSPMIKEGSTHSPAPEMAVRTLWTLFGEGMKGTSIFTIQESPKPELRKFGLSNPDDDMAPRPKLGAYSDMFRSLQHIENLIAPTSRKSIGKPVAIYYSQTCNLMQERGYGSMFDSAPDTYFRVFELIRANGYPCTVITDRQIMETDRLDKVSAIFFIDAQYIPTEVVDKIGTWVEKGGHIICDSSAGAYDGHGFPSDKMIKLLGIEPVIKKRVDESAAEQLQFGYSSQSYEVINADELWQTQMEYLHQRASQHPIAKMMDKVMFSGFGFREVKSLDGEVVILHNNGGVGFNVRQVGKGSASYFAGYLGTIYGGGATQYEWRDAHSDDSAYRFFDAILTFVGARKNAQVDLEEASSLRLGSPLVGKSGNMVSAITSYADHTLRSFKARTFLPKGVRPPKQVFFTRNSSRVVEKLDFEYNEELNAVEYTAPGFRVFGNALLIQEAAPIVSVDFGDAPRDAYGLLDIRPGDEVVASVRVFNPSDRRLKEGAVTLRLPDGWFYDKESVKIPAIDGRGESAVIQFKIKAPAVCASRRIKPINFIYESGDITSTPAVEVAWFQKAPQVKSKF